MFKKFNVRIKWADGGEGPAMLKVAAYMHGLEAPNDSWVFLHKGASTDVRE